MDFVHYQPPRDRESKVKPEKRDLQRAAEQGPLGVGIKAQLRTADFASQDPLVSPMDDAEDVETSTRPRLSPEQVWLLERQFQAHPKPSSHRKRQLAEMTKLSLPRVAVGFPCPQPCTWPLRTLIGRRIGSRTDGQRLSIRRNTKRLSSHAPSKPSAGRTPRSTLLQRWSLSPALPPRETYRRHREQLRRSSCAIPSVTPHRSLPICVGCMVDLTAATPRSLGHRSRPSP